MHHLAFWLCLVSFTSSVAHRPFGPAVCFRQYLWGKKIRLRTGPSTLRMPNRTIFSLNRTIFSVVKIALIALYLVPYSHLICSLLAPNKVRVRIGEWLLFALIFVFLFALFSDNFGRTRSSYSHYLNNRAIWMRLWPNSANKRKIPPGSIYLSPISFIWYVVCCILHFALLEQ